MSFKKIDFRCSGQNLRLGTVLILVIYLLGFGVANADYTQQQVYQLGIEYFDVDGGSESCGTDASTGTTVLTGNDNAQKAYNFFVNKGLTNFQAAGILGNFQQESGMNPNEPGGYLAQWGGGRLTALQTLASQEGKPVTDLGVQLDFVWKELSGSYSGVLTHVKATTNYTDATTQFMGPDPIPPPGHGVSGGYENPGDPQTDKRIGYASGFLNLYGGGSGGETTSTTSTDSGGCAGGGNGQNTKFIDGFTIYDQCDPTWGGKAYGGDTICADGCGPSSMAMIITNLTGQKVTPDATAAYATSQNLYASGQGTKWSVGPVEAAHWGLHSKAIGSDVTSINAALQEGGLVIVAGEGPVPFTTGGHFIVIRGLASDGKWKVGDPDGAHTGASDQEWDPNQLVTSMNQGSAYEITK